MLILWGFFFILFRTKHSFQFTVSSILLPVLWLCWYHYQSKCDANSAKMYKSGCLLALPHLFILMKRNAHTQTEVFEADLSTASDRYREPKSINAHQPKIFQVINIVDILIGTQVENICTGEWIKKITVLKFS